MLNCCYNDADEYIRGGFSFCGIDIADIGLEYAPDIKDTYVYATATTNVHEETFEGHDGGYSYGSYKEPKTFTLRCIFEEEHIAKGLMAKVFHLFQPGKKGKLIFKRRPWCYYYATVTSVPDLSEVRNYLNGIITITMKAYYPFARGIEINNRLFCSLPTDPYHNEIMENTALLDKDYMVPNTQLTTPITGQTSILLYNPGTERAKVDIVISGSAGDGVTIANSTTNQKCRYVAFNTNGNQYIYTDGISGKTVLDDDGARELAFLYHDYGFIELEPAFPILRKIYATCEGNTVTTVNILFEDEAEQEWYAGKYIFIGNENGSWHKIVQCQDKHTLIISNTASQATPCYSCIALMNEITITPTHGSSLSRLSFIYKPTFA